MGSGEVDGTRSEREGGRESSRPKLLVDVMCGTLASYLRMCGYDAAYALDRDVEADDRLLAIADDEQRVVVTRDRELAARADEAVLLTERDVVDQLRELDRAGYPIELAAEPGHCGSCNGQIERVAFTDEPTADSPTADKPTADSPTADGSIIEPDRPDYVPDDADPVWRCESCGRYFWKGSHWDRVGERIADL